MNLLRSHIQMNVWQVGVYGHTSLTHQIGDQYYRQKTGIPQGSKISSLLCSFFYSFMEAEHLAWTRRPGTVRSGETRTNSSSVSSDISTTFS
jgi:telomerase reverse transcriptase